jgi:hypothetical protein
MDSFHCCGNSSLFQIELVSLWISKRDALPPAWITSTEFDQYLVIYTFSAFQ